MSSIKSSMELEAQMKAVVLAGGFGTRLRPLSCTRPKHLFPIGNKPQMDWTIERLSKSGIKEVILAVNYMAEVYIQHYRKTQKPKIAFLRDVPVSDTHTPFQRRPLGTGGAIKNAEKMVEHKESFLVLNGDILTNLDYAQLMKRHRSNKKAAATIALYKVKDPSRYGVAELSKNSSILRFIEKPARDKAPSNLINAGIYVLEPEIFDYIPSGRPVSIEREVFPTLAQEGKLYGYNFKGLWIDIGEPKDYLKANKLWLLHEIKKSQIGKNVRIKDGAEIKNPSAIGNCTTIGEKSEIGPYVTIGEHVTIGKEVHVENSIIFPSAMISDSTSIKGAAIGEAAIIGSRVKIGNGCLIGDHAMIRDNVALARGVTVCPWKEVAESVLKPKCLM